MPESAMHHTINNSIHLFSADALDCYTSWPSPVVIVSDGPYGVNGYLGDLKSYHGLAE